jgi:hypothetical protein
MQTIHVLSLGKPQKKSVNDGQAPTAPTAANGRQWGLKGSWLLMTDADHLLLQKIYINHKRSCNNVSLFYFSGGPPDAGSPPGAKHHQSPGPAQG